MTLLLKNRGRGLRILFLSLLLVLGIVPDGTEGIKCWNCNTVGCRENPADCTKGCLITEDNKDQGCGNPNPNGGKCEDGICFCNYRDFCHDERNPTPKPTPPPPPTTQGPGAEATTESGPGQVGGSKGTEKPSSTSSGSTMKSSTNTTTSAPVVVVDPPGGGTSSGHSFIPSSLWCTMMISILMVYFGSIRGGGAAVATC